MWRIIFGILFGYASIELIEWRVGQVTKVFNKAIKGLERLDGGIARTQEYNKKTIYKLDKRIRKYEQSNQGLNSERDKVEKIKKNLMTLMAVEND